MSGRIPSFHLLAVAFVCLFALPAAGREIELRDGRQLDGQIVKETDETITIRLRFGELTVPRKQIERVGPSRTLYDRYVERREKVGGTASGQVALARWCFERGLKVEGRQALERALDLDPEHEEARRLHKAHPLPAGEEDRSPGTERAWLASQFAFEKEAERKLGLRLRTMHSGEILLHAHLDYSTRSLRRFRRTAWQLLRKLRPAFGLEKDASPWPGEMQIFLFTADNRFEAFGKKLDGRDVTKAGGYFHVKRADRKYHVVVYGTSKRVLIHELSHALMAASRGTLRPAPWWLDEGYATWLELHLLDGPKNESNRYRWDARKLFAESPEHFHLKSMMKRNDADCDWDNYIAAYSLVDHLLRHDKFWPLVDALKKGPHPDAEAQKAALERITNQSLETVESDWHKALQLR